MISLLSKYGAIAFFHSFNNCFSWAFWRVSGLYTYRLHHAEYKQFPSFSAF